MSFSFSRSNRTWNTLQFNLSQANFNQKVKPVEMSPPHKKNGIPDRWLDYRAVGKRLPGTRFIAFKVPLKSGLNSHLSSGDVFGHWELLDAVKRENQELGLIIDLTFTTRYYKAEDVPESLHCVKIFTAGHEIPSDATILTFKRTVRRFLRENSENEKLIGVHCTHGLNRTGYLVCRYLIDVDGVDPLEAIELFNCSRGHAIERKNYLEDLQSGPKRSNEGIEESVEEPVQGRATHRPVYSEVAASRVEERPSFSQESSKNRRQKHRQNHSRFESNRYFVGTSSGGPGLLPAPRGPALPPFPRRPGSLPVPTFPPAQPSSSAYRWVRGSQLPPPNYQWPGPPIYSSGGRGSSHLPQGLSSYQWTNENDFGRYNRNGPEEWDGPKLRPQMRHNRRMNQYDY